MTMHSDPPVRLLELRGTDLVAGTLVEVWCVSLSDWVRGFAVDDVSESGITLTRLSDGAVLPERFDPVSVRAAVGSVSRTPSWH